MRARLNPMLAFLAFCLIWLLHRTYRVRIHGQLPTDSGALLFAFWHGEQQLILPAARTLSRPLAVMTSLSIDGQLQARILRRLGLDVVSGSSSRGGAAGLLSLVRLVQSGACVAHAIDGPRGPRLCAKPGIIQLARSTRTPIVPLRAVASHGLTFRRAWDQFQIPLPFARIDLHILPPLDLPPHLSLRNTQEEAAAFLSEYITNYKIQ